MIKKTYREILTSEFSVRTFPETTKEENLTWHSNNEDREITFLHNSDWRIQFDGGRTIRIIEGESIIISEGEYYRFIKGKGELKIKLKKLNKTRLLPHTLKA